MTTALNLRLDPQVKATDYRRGHRFQPPASDLRKIPGIGGCRDGIVRLHYFVGGWDWYITELDPATFEAYGLVTSPFCPHGEWGYIDLAELALVQAGATVNGIPFSQPVERDCWWSPVPSTTIGVDR
jgi:hypothetical protein